MPYCPVCYDEFQEWVEVCPDCNVALARELPVLPERKETDETLVHIATAPNEPIANMWSGILEEHNIRCLLKGGNLGAAMYIPNLLLPFEIYVLASEAEKAKEIISPFLED